MTIQPRPYQQETHDKCFEYLQKGIWRQLAVMATGTGKTFTTGLIAKSLPARLNCAGRVLWLTHEESLIEQSALSVLRTLFPEYAKRISDAFPDNTGLLEFMQGARLRKQINAFDRANTDAQVDTIILNNLGIIKQTLFNKDPRLVVASVQTIVNRLDRFPPDWFDMVVVDECHLAMSPSWSKVINYFTPKLRLGLTATPSRLDGLSLGDLFDQEIVNFGLKYGIDNGFLCEMEAILLPTNIDLTGIKKTGGEFNTGELGAAVDRPERNIKIVRKWQEVAEGRPTIAYCVTVEHAMNLAWQFNELGVPATFVVADEKLCPDRKKRVKDFKNGKYHVICNVGILVAGFDHPDTGAIISAAPTMSETKFYQSIGRGSRLKSQAFIDRFKKNNCLIIDVTDNSKRHAIVNTESLDKGKRFEEKIFIGKERKADLIAKRDAGRKLQHVQEEEERFSLLSLPKLKIQMSDARMKRPASQDQLNFIARFGFDIVNESYTDGQCNQIILQQEATRTMYQFLQANGYDVSQGATRENFAAAQREVLERNTTKMFNDKNKSRNPFMGLK